VVIKNNKGKSFKREIKYPCVGFDFVWLRKLWKFNSVGNGKKTRQ